MQVKISTKEKFSVITPSMSHLAAILADELGKILLAYIDRPVKNVVLNLQQTEKVDKEVADMLVDLQQQFYEHDASLVICCLSKAVETQFDELGLLEMMNTTPTESEAGDIVQMEEIERDFLKGGD